jgi:Cu/Zn superoxide dismutase
MVETPVAAQRQPVDLPAAGGHLDRRGAVVGGEVAAAGEPGDMGNVADDQPGDDRADAE